MNEQDRTQLAETLAQVLDGHRGVDAETHKRHHERIAASIEREQTTMAFWEAIRKTVFGWGIIVVLTGIGYAAYDWAHHLLGRLFKAFTQ